ncbi:MAG: putative Dynein heavy chain family protein [Streblomastix strix]|uniref:Putative Dynein heavy chain family protein n=1 Tax=Streblomastix strix TaxID=222440 RepID=A0A5J4VPA0_9EUKA|nr:MAG: putative Dynein heavy chain family protein [Streblomastix strix]
MHTGPAETIKTKTIKDLAKALACKCVVFNCSDQIDCRKQWADSSLDLSKHRTELHENLNALFRPVALMIPDYAQISEIMLFSKSFHTDKDLSYKMIRLYKPSSEQLSQLDHYNFCVISTAQKIQGMQPAQQFILDCLQVYETMEVRWGLILVSDTKTCKTTCLRALSNGLYNIHEGASEGKAE